jgi:hypothetical protein
MQVVLLTRRSSNDIVFAWVNFFDNPFIIGFDFKMHNIAHRDGIGQSLPIQSKFSDDAAIKDFALCAFYAIPRAR